MPKELLLRIKPSKWLLLFYAILNSTIAYIILFHLPVYAAWRGLICISLALHFALIYYRLKNNPSIQEMHFIQVPNKQNKGYITYLQSQDQTKQPFELVAAWQFFARCVLLQCRLMHRKKSCWFLLLPDSLSNKDHLRKLVLILRFGKFTHA